MKIDNAMKSIYYIVAIFCCALWLSACESNREAADPGPGTWGNCLRVVKFSSPEYPNYVVVEKDYDGDYEHFCQLRPCYNLFIELVIGSSPYIALPDNYYAVAWEWGQIIYPPTNFLIDVPWSDVEDCHQKWEYTSRYITSQFLTEKGAVGYRAIDNYFNIESANKNDYIKPAWMDEIYCDYDSFESLPDSLAEDFREKAKYQDSLQSVYIERLSQIIKEGHLDKVLYRHPIIYE